MSKILTSDLDMLRKVMRNCECINYLKAYKVTLKLLESMLSENEYNILKELIAQQNEILRITSYQMYRHGYYDGANVAKTCSKPCIKVKVKRK